MIDRQSGCICFECDSCDEVFTGAPMENFPEVWNRAKDDGWRAHQIGNDWVHSCPSCNTGPRS